MYFQDHHPITTAPIPAVRATHVPAVPPVPVHQAILPLEAAQMRRQEGFKKDLFKHITESWV